MDRRLPTKRCTCGANMIMAMTSKRQRLPLDVEPSPDGVFELIYKTTGAGATPTATPTAAYVPPELRGGRGDLYVAHFASCPHAAVHRRPRGR